MGLCRTLTPAQLCLKQRVTAGTGSALAWGMNSEKILRPIMLLPPEATASVWTRGSLRVPAQRCSQLASLGLLFSCQQGCEEQPSYIRGTQRALSK